MTFNSAFEDAVIGGKNVRTVLQGIEQDILRLSMRKLVTEPAAEGINKLVRAGMQALFPPQLNMPGLNLPFEGFASGGDFTVGGAGGTDSRFVGFMATPGERISVKTPAQQAAGAVSNTTINVNISTPDASSFRQSEGQIAAKIAAAVLAGRRNL